VSHIFPRPLLFLTERWLCNTRLSHARLSSNHTSPCCRCQATGHCTGPANTLRPRFSAHLLSSHLLSSRMSRALFFSFTSSIIFPSFLSFRPSLFPSSPPPSFRLTHSLSIFYWYYLLIHNIHADDSSPLISSRHRFVIFISLFTRFTFDTLSVSHTHTHTRTHTHTLTHTHTHAHTHGGRGRERDAPRRSPVKRNDLLLCCCCCCFLTLVMCGKKEVSVENVNRARSDEVRRGQRTSREMTSWRRVFV